MFMKNSEFIKIRGAKENNLKNIDVDIPINKFVVITGLSGSGKSSLAFDTIYAEGQRRYVESLSAYARQFIGLMNKPDVEAIHGLSPAISIEQKNLSKNPRSTVGTVTEIYDYLRLLFARIGVPHCPKCGKKIQPQTAEDITESLMKLKSGTKMQILAPVIRGQKGLHEEIIKEIKDKGFRRMRIDGKMHTTDEKIKLKRYAKHNIEVIIDRVQIKDDLKTRLQEDIETALIIGSGLVIILIDDKEKLYSQENACPECGISFEKLQPRMFSFNTPFGACEECQGLGFKQEFDPELIIPDEKLSIAEGAIAPYKTHGEGWRNQLINAVLKHFGYDMWIPIKKLPEKVFQALLYGTDEEIRVTISSRTTESSYNYKGAWEGIIPQMERLYKETQSDYRREDMERFMRILPCPACEGKRLKPESLAVTIENKNIYEITTLSIKDCDEFFRRLPDKLSQKNKEISKNILKEVIQRLEFLINVGLDYLTLERKAETLSGGEAQRIRLATQIGTELRGVLYILDEPSIGLHQRDNNRLISTLKRLRDLGNTLIVVEHDEDTILGADYVIDIGPGAGIHGGEIISQGAPAKIKADPKSLTGQYLSGKKQISLPLSRRRPTLFFELKGCEEHNLQNINVKFPLGVFCCITGVSGSGKSTLISDTLHKVLAQKIYNSKERPGKYKDIVGADKIDKVVVVDQSPIGRTPRSNPATYTGVFTPIRELFTNTMEAKKRGYKAGRFSFNVPVGRCETCEGDGVIKIEMHFLPDVYVTCEKCKGQRYNSETLQVLYKNKNIAEILNMTVEEALAFFENMPGIRNKLQTLYDVGLGYIKLGQSATTLSGGEAQRIKLTAELAKKGTGKTLYILDEPTTGLHFHDIKKLLAVLNRLVEKGNTVMVIEHNLDVIKTADYIIDLDPEGGDKGGRVVAIGSPEEIVQKQKGYTWKYLKKFLNK